MAYQGFTYDGDFNQTQWEEFWAKSGATKYLAQQNKLKDRGCGDLTNAGSRLLSQYLDATSVAISEMIRVKPNATPVEVQALRQIDPKVAAYIGLREVVSKTLKDKKGVVLFTTMADAIGSAIEKEERALYLEKNDERFLEWQHFLVKDQKQPAWYRNKKIGQALDMLDLSWVNWDKKTRILVGSRVIKALEVAGFLREDIKRTAKRKTSQIRLEENVLQSISRNEEFVASLMPIHMPAIEKPKDWTCLYDGGYHSANMNTNTPLVKMRKYQRKELEDVEMPDVYKATNRLQSTKFDINRDVLNVAKELFGDNLIPGMESLDNPPVLHFAEDWKYDTAPEEEQKAFKKWKADRSMYYKDEDSVNGKRLEFSMALNLAAALVTQEDRLGFKGFYYVWQTDFRGRFYPTCTVLSPQGSDVHKGLLQFAAKKPLGDTGERSLCIQGANVYGKDKLTLDERVQWVLDNENAIINIANNPLDTREDWLSADKPWQFLAFCFEWARYRVEGEDFLTCLPVASDGSCNGLQHYSAALLDDVGGSSTNVIPSDTPNDIYQDVADVLKGKLENIKHPNATKILKFGINRKMTKRQVMTLPYGATLYSCREYTLEYLDENMFSVFPTIQERIEVAHWLSPMLWDSIGEVVKKGREAMDWLVECASIASKQNVKIDFKTPSGFRVYYTNFKTKSDTVKFRVDGKQKYVSIATELDKINVSKVSNSIAPNFVHSLDATHMVWTVNAMPEGTSFCMVHDSFATHAGDYENLNNKLREQFFRLYNNYEVFEDFRSALQEKVEGILPELPDKGNLDLSCVKSSTYFFS
jgi:DNA-directed RNA polymerase